MRSADSYTLLKQAEALDDFVLELHAIVGSETAEAAKETGYDPDSFFAGINSALEHATWTAKLLRKNADKLKG